MRPIDADELKKAIDEVHQKDLKANPLWGSIGLNTLNRLIDNAPTVPLPDFKEGYKQAILDGKTNFSRPEGEWIKHCPVYQQKDLYEQKELKLVDVNALIEHLDATMYRDVIDEIKNFPTITPVLTRQVNGSILLIPTRTFEDIKNGTISSIEIRGEEE